MAVFSRAADSIGGLRGTIIFYSVLLLVAGVLSMIFIPNNKPEKVVQKAEAKESAPLKWKNFLEVAKMPRV